MKKYLIHFMSVDAPSVEDDGIDAGTGFGIHPQTFDSKEEAEKFINEVDKLCDDYAKRHTGVSRYDPRNYDFVISMKDRTEEEAVDLILKYIGA